MADDTKKPSKLTPVGKAIQTKGGTKLTPVGKAARTPDDFLWENAPDKGDGREGGMAFFNKALVDYNPIVAAADAVTFPSRWVDRQINDGQGVLGTAPSDYVSEGMKSGDLYEGFLEKAGEGLETFLPGFGVLKDFLVGEEDTGVAEAVGGALRTPSMAEPGAQPDTTGEKVGAMVGAGIGVASGLGVGSGAALSRIAPEGAKRAPSLVEGILRTFRDPVVQRPIGSMVLEGIAGAGAVAGGEKATDLAEGYGIDPALVAPLGEVVGGIAAPGAALAAGAALSRTSRAITQNAPVLGGAIAVGKRLMDPETAAWERASDTLIGRAGGASAARDAAGNMTDRADTMTGLTPAMLASGEGSPNMGLLLTERVAREADPAAAAAFDAQRRRGMAEAENYLNNLGDGVEPATFSTNAAQPYVVDAKQNIAQMVNEAIEEADAAIVAAAPNGVADPAQNSLIFRGALEKAEDRSSKAVGALWDQVPKEVTGRLANARVAFSNLVKEAGKNEGYVIDPYFYDMFGKQMGGKFVDGKLSAVETAQNIHGAYSRARTLERQYTASGDQQAARVASKMAAALLEDLNALPDMKGPLQAAREATREHHDVFTRGVIGQVLRSSRDGGEVVLPEQTLKRLFGSASDEGFTVSTEAMTTALGPYNKDTAEGYDAAERYIRNQFQNTINRVDDLGTSKFAPASADRFVQNRLYTLRQYPALLESFDTAVAAAQAALRSQADATLQKKQLDSSVVAKLVDPKVYKEFDIILSEPDPGAAMAELVGVARFQDETGAAEKALKTMFGNFVLSKAKTQHEGLGPIIRGSGESGFASILADPRTNLAVRALFSEEEVGRMRVLADELGLWQIATGKQTSTGNAQLVPQDAGDMILRPILGVLGATGGRKLMTGTIQGPGIVADMARKAGLALTSKGAEKLLIDATTDPDLYRALLLGTSPSEEARRRGQEVFAAWAATLPGIYNMEVDVPDQDTSNDDLDTVLEGLGLQRN